MANKQRQLSGQQFGRLTVLDVAHRIGGVHWVCQCSCGKQNVTLGSSLTRGKVKSCGCLLKQERPPKSDLSGQRFGRLVVLSLSETRVQRSRSWDCLCDCGNTTLVSGPRLVDGTTRSCGCLRTDTHTKHGMSKTPEFNAWVHMRERCYSPGSNRWHTHGARGIAVCDRWVESFTNFFSDMGSKPSPKHSLERIDNDGDYTPENCKWATDSEQAGNRRDTRKHEFNGKTQSLKAWCRELEIPYLRTYKRIVYRNKTFEEAIR